MHGIDHSLQKIKKRGETMKKSIKKIVSLLATATIVFSSVSALAAPEGWSTTLDFSGKYWEETVNTIKTTENPSVANIFEYAGSINGLNKARATFDASYETEGGRSYIKLTPTNVTEALTGQGIAVEGDFFTKIGKTTGRQHFTFDFTLLDTVTNPVVDGKEVDVRRGGQNAMKLRLWGDAGGYSLKVAPGWEANSMIVSVGNYDAQWAHLDNATNGSNVVTAGTWCRYYVDYDCYTNQMVVGIKNADTGDDIVGPITKTLTQSPYLQIQSSLPSFNNATYCLGDMKYWKDTFVCDNSSKAITADDTTVTAKVDMANDVSTSLTWWLYGNATWDDHTNTSEPMLILAQYDANDHFLGLTTKSLSGELPRDTQTQTTAPTMHEMSVTMDKADGYAYAKAFLWDSMSGLDAFSDAWTNK
jgi:hypothetical protein